MSVCLLPDIHRVAHISPPPRSLSGLARDEVFLQVWDIRDSAADP